MPLLSTTSNPLSIGLRFAIFTLAFATASTAMAQDADEPAAPKDEHAGHEGHDMGGMDMSGMDMPGTDMAGMKHGEGDAMSGMMTGAFGGYDMTRDASGTSWQPDSSVHAGIHSTRGEWMLMGHALLNGVYDWQGGPRGDTMGYVAGMFMGMARRGVGERGLLQLRAMLSPDPLMGKRGYPLLLQAGETANGVSPLVDRQHPHDLFMELSASYSYRYSEHTSVYFYAGLPGEPAFGPPAFMHRLSILDSPEAPISHHWLDSTHITFGVATVGVVVENWKLEGSRFHGREPDQFRYNIETGALDSSALRLSWNPAPNWSLQASWADVHSPEQLEAEADQVRWSASAIYTRPFGADGWWSTTLAWGRRSSEGVTLDAYALESALKPNEHWTIFARAERAENNELVGGDDEHGPAFDVAKFSLGAIRDFRVASHASIGVGALYAMNFVPEALDPSYGDDPAGAMVFVRWKVD